MCVNSFISLKKDDISESIATVVKFPGIPDRESGGAEFPGIPGNSHSGIPGGPDLHAFVG